MLKAKIDEKHTELEVSGTAVTIMAELTSLVDSVIESLSKHVGEEGKKVLVMGMVTYLMKEIV